MGLTKMLATKRSPWRRAVSMRLTWPAWRFPIVGTKAMRRPSLRQRRTCSRTAAMVVTVSIRSEAVFRGGIGARADGLDVALQRLAVVAGALHKVLDETRLAPGGDVENVVDDEDLPIRRGSGADADDGNLQLLRDRLAQVRGDALEEHDVRACRFQALGIRDHLRGRIPLAA